MLIKKVKQIIPVVAKVVSDLTSNSETDVPSVKAVNDGLSNLIEDNLSSGSTTKSPSVSAVNSGLSNNLLNSIKIEGVLSNGTSFNDLATNGKSTACTVSGTHSNSPGFPTGAYNYGTIITINPEKKKYSYWGTIQIYIPDLPAQYGVYFRTQIAGAWVKITGTGVNGKS